MDQAGQCRYVPGIRLATVPDEVLNATSSPLAVTPSRAAVIGGGPTATRLNPRHDSGGSALLRPGA